uniref:Reverse transcriptase domain-containing protein n=1 Tax=Trichuris muris TaxID=70415 RepID=A0A5S6QP22_TRIMR
MERLKGMFERPVNQVHARCRLATRKQQPGESIDDFLRALKALSADCNLKAVSTSQYREELVRDAFVSGLIDSLIHGLAKYKFFSSIDLKNAYHQVPIDPPLPRLKLRERVIHSFIEHEKLEGTFAYLDDITICGVSKADHDKNLERFLNAARKWNFTFNEAKSTFSTTKLRILGYEIENGEIRPDPLRLQPLRDLPVPYDKKTLQRALGLFAYYSQWICNYSGKLLKEDIEKSAVHAVDESLGLELETDASEVALAAVLNQLGRPVAFFSRTLQPHERRYAAVEKEAQAIVEAVRHWRHYLTDFDIIHRPGKDNIAPDVLSRAFCGTVDHDNR